MLQGWSWEGVCPEDLPIFSLNRLVADPTSLLPLKQKNHVACFNKSHVSSNHCEKTSLPRWNSTFVGACAAAAFLRIYFLDTWNVKGCKINKSQLTVASWEMPLRGKGLECRGNPWKARHWWLQELAEAWRWRTLRIFLGLPGDRSAGRASKPKSLGWSQTHSSVSLDLNSGFIF